MDWIRVNKSLAGIVGVAVAGALGLGIYLFLTYSAYSDSYDSLQALSGKIAGMEKAKLYPNEANVDAKEEKVSAYEEEVGKLGGVLLSLQKDVTSPPIKDTDFQGNLKQSIVEIREKSKGSLFKEFAFGFDEYTRALPPQEATQDLKDYLDGVTAIVNAALDSGVKSIDALSRSSLAIEKGGAQKQKKAAAAPKPKPVVSKAKKKGAKEKVVAKPVEITQMVERRVVTLDLTTDQAPLQNFVNTLASATLMKHFTVVRVLRIENEKMEGPPSKAAPMTGNNGLKVQDSNGLISAAAPETDKSIPHEGDSAAAAASKVEVITAAKPAPPDAIKVLGGELLKAHFEIDLVRFLEPDADAAAPAGAAR
ncbi:MAG: hypothetical protein JWO94_878 [Verrucomicrobiaceae bacterium]|nr:hypothetical protein [Verrucomicrobiaceae bacterium]